MKTSQFILITHFCLLIACQSKFEESKPEGVSRDDGAKTEYTLKSKNILERFTKAQELIMGLDELISKPEVRKVLRAENGSMSGLIYSIIDSVKTKSSEKTSTGYVSYGEVYLTLPGLAPECRMLNTKSIYQQDEDQVKHKIQVMTCKTQNQYKSILDISISSDSRISLLVDAQISEILPDVNLSEALSLQGCAMTKDSKGILNHIDCEAGDWVISPHDVIRFTHFSYDSQADIRYRAKVLTLVDGVPKLDITLEIDHFGKFLSPVIVVTGK